VEAHHLGKMKKPLSTGKNDSKEDEIPKQKERPWWARSDADLVKDRYDKVKDWYESKKVDVDDEDRQQIIEEAVRRDPRIKNLLDIVVIKDEKVGKKDEFLMVPIYSSQKGKKIASTFRLNKVRRIKLDEYGWGVWNLIDGKRDVRRIGKILSRRFGKKIEPLYPRLAKFLAYLQNLKLIEFEEK
jgi:coenzyme PQQ synthesis protein D (PqqD)